MPRSANEQDQHERGIKNAFRAETIAECEKKMRKSAIVVANVVR
jgi:hypothetical protein